MDYEVLQYCPKEPIAPNRSATALGFMWTLIHQLKQDKWNSQI